MDQKTFELEQEHLTEIYRKLQARKQSLEQQIEVLNATASDEKNDIRDNLRFDTADDEVKTEMYGEIETWNRYIDSYNVKSAVLSDALKKVNLLLDSPYFARVTLQFDPSEEPESYYIGRAALTEENGVDQMIVDWRSPIAETYYNQDNGRTFYMVNDRRIDVDLLLRRQFDLNRDRLNAYFDTSVAIEDPMLLGALSKQRTDKMQAITVTIQKEQNAVIRYPDVPVLLVNGIAGSGKTSVLLQRIAYLFYHHRKTLRPDNVYLLTLNPIFQQYISGVLPDLGEQNPNTMTWLEFLEALHVPAGKPGPAEEAEQLRRIDEALPQLKLTEEDLRAVSQKGKCVLSRAEILDVLHQFDDRIETGVRLTHVAEEELLERAKRSLRRKRNHADEDENGLEGHVYSASGSDETDAGNEEDTRGGQNRPDGQGAVPLDTQSRLMMEIPLDEPQAGRRAGRRDADSAESLAQENELVSSYGGAFRMIRDFGWLDLGHIGERILGVKHLTAIEFLYLRMALTGECDRMAQYVMIDEVQDYTEAQLMALARYFPNAKFMLLGDEFQSIREGTVSFEGIHRLFGEMGRKVVELPLMTSYRSSPEITELFAGLLPEERRLDARSVQRPGIAPEIREFDSHKEYVKALREAVRQAGASAPAAAPDTAKVASGAAELEDSKAASPGETGGLTAVLCQNRRSLGRVRDLLGEDAPQVLRGNEKLPKSGVFLISLEYAKGLEFDSVILPDADEKTCPAGAPGSGTELLTRHRLYTAISRATQKLTILSDGKLTTLLTAACR